MKKIVMLMLVVVCGVMFSNSWAKRPKKGKPTQELTTAERIDSLKRVAELREQEEWRMNIPYRAGPYKQPIQLQIPCSSESYDTSEYRGGFGVGSGRTIQEAMQRAQIAAIRDIQSKGYSNVSDMQIACQQISQDSNGEYTCYMAVHVPIKKGVDSIKEDDLIILFDSAQRDSLKQILRRKLDSLENAQETTTK